MRVDLGMLMMAVDRALATADDPTADGQILKLEVQEYPSYLRRREGNHKERIVSEVTLVSEKYWIGDKLIYRWSVDIGECV